MARSSKHAAMGWFLQVVRVLASCTSLGMILSPLPTLYNIYMTKATGNASLLPLVSMLINCHLWMFYGYLSRSYFPLFATFITGDAITLAYICVFYRWCDSRRDAYRLLLVGVVVVLLSSIYAAIGLLGWTGQTRAQMSNVIGYCSMTASIVLYLSPLKRLGAVFRHRSNALIPIHMVIAGCMNNLMWVAYGALTSDWIIVIPNVITFTTGLAQVVIFAVFASRPPSLDHDSTMVSPTENQVYHKA